MPKRSEDSTTLTVSIKKVTKQHLIEMAGADQRSLSNWVNLEIGKLYESYQEKKRLEIKY